MITSKIAAHQTYAEITRIRQNSLDHPDAKKGIRPSGAESVEAIETEVKASLVGFSVSRLQQFNDEFGSVLKSVRIADQALQQTEANVEQMKSEVQAILKMYPPYPPGSEERVEMLKRYAGLREEIEELTLPKDPLAKEIVAESGVSVPGELGVTASDEALVAAQGELDRSLDAIQLARKNLSDNVQGIIRDLK